MLNRLRLENFKAWREADLALGKVTGLFGTNSSGKSSLLQLLLLLKQTRNATDRGLVLDFGGPSEMVNLGTFNDVVHRHDEQVRIGWLLEWTLAKVLRISDPMDGRRRPLFEGNSIQTRCEVGLRHARLWPSELAYRFGGTDFMLRPKASSETKFELSTDSEFKFISSRGRPATISHPVKTHLFPSPIRARFQNADFLSDFELAYENLMDSIFYLGPLREYPRREYHWAGSSPDDVGQRGERTVDAILAATLRNEKRGLRPRGRGIRRMPFQKMIAHWLNELELIQEFSLKEIAKGSNLYRAMVRAPSTSVPTALTDVGFGVSQVLPALVLLYYVPEGSTVLMEQPEIHLHPSVQSGLADVMLNVATTRNVQIIVESHSEHLMRRLQRRVAEEQVSSDVVKLYFVSTEQGAAKASDLKLNEWGEIENWPDKFFGDEVGDIVAITENAIQRRMDSRA